MFGNYRKTYNPTQLKSNPNTQFENEIIEETYIIDPQTGQKIILETKTTLKVNNNQIHNKINPQQNLHTGKPIQMPKKESNNINDNAFSDLTLKEDPTLPYEEYPNVEFSKHPFMNISGFGFNSYNRKVK